MTAEAKKNKDMANVAPGTYEFQLTDKKAEPRWSMGTKLEGGKRKNIGPGPQAYDLPTKMVEKQGKTIGARLKSSLESLGKG